MLESGVYMNSNLYYRPSYNKSYNGDRQFFFPFLTGALVGGAAVGLTRPRPIYNVAPSAPGFGPRVPYGVPYAYSSYGGYIPARPY